MTAIADLIDKHRAWLAGEVGGSQLVLRGAVLRYAVLSGADLSDADLDDADLRDVVLSGAVLRYAVLSGADLRGADLRGADLRGADLSDADLSDANLSGADLSGANLSGADLSGANLRDANIEGAPLPDGWSWWQGGCYGPRRRMVRVLRHPDGAVTVMLGCITSTPDEALARLRLERHAAWVDEIGADAADAALEQVRELIATAVRHLGVEEGTNE